VVINKWDLAKSNSNQDDYGDYITRELPEIAYAPIVFSSALDGTGVTQAIQIAQELYRQAQIRISTADLNKVMEEIVAQSTPHTPTGKPGRLYYASQVATNPPTITCFVNEISAFETNFQRFLLNQLHDRLPYSEIPIRLIFRPRRRGEKPPKGTARD
jgi:GTPase